MIGKAYLAVHKSLPCVFNNIIAMLDYRAVTRLITQDINNYINYIHDCR